MNNSFKVNVSGGNVSLGAASQGDHSSVAGTSTMRASIVGETEALYKALEVLAQLSRADRDEYAAAQKHCSELVAAVKAQEKSRASAALEVVQKNFSWAYPALKDFVKLVWPALLAAIGT